MRTNAYGPFFMARSLVRNWLNLPSTVDPTAGQNGRVPALRNVNLSKQIIFVSSISAIVSMYPQNQVAYNASKGAVTMMAKVCLKIPCRPTSHTRHMIGFGLD